MEVGSDCKSSCNLHEGSFETLVVRHRVTIGLHHRARLVLEAAECSVMGDCSTRLPQQT